MSSSNDLYYIKYYFTKISNKVIREPVKGFYYSVRESYGDRPIGSYGKLKDLKSKIYLFSKKEADDFVKVCYSYNEPEREIVMIVKKATKEMINLHNLREIIE